MNLTPSEVEYLRDILKERPLNEDKDYPAINHERLQRKMENYLVRLKW
tara:strand:- start:134 stop:277 length:144 start_codon:yes stop_codon:yes gene_type:complete